MEPNQLFEEFQRTNRLMRRKIYENREEAAGEVFAPGQNRLLHVLAEYPGINQKDLAAKLRIRPASLSELLKKAEAKGLVLREQNQQDRRVNNFSLTPAGQALRTEFEDIRQAFGQELFQVLDDQDRQALGQILTKLQESLE